jgi:hypothetical protein
LNGSLNEQGQREHDDLDHHRDTSGPLDTGIRGMGLPRKKEALRDSLRASEPPPHLLLHAGTLSEWQVQEPLEVLAIGFELFGACSRKPRPVPPPGDDRMTQVAQRDEIRFHVWAVIGARDNVVRVKTDEEVASSVATDLAAVAVPLFAPPGQAPP